MSEPKKHHFLSKFYLAGFTMSGEEDGELFCYNIDTKSMRPSKPLNEGYVKYFNRIESNSEDPNKLEKELAKMEGSVAEIVKLIQKSKELPDGEKLNELIYFITLIGLRNPQIRRDFQEFQENISYRVLELMLSSKSLWESQMEKIQEKYGEKFKDITYEEMKKFIKNNKLKLVDQNENKIAFEFSAIDKVYNCLLQRNWILIRNEDENVNFVTSDRPVKNIWSDNSFYKYGPGFCLKKSELYFPLTRDIMLRGSYKLKSANIHVNREMVATLNNLQLMYRYRFIYSPTQEFIVNADGKVINSSAI